MTFEPGARAGFHAWQASADGVAVCFAGKPVVAAAAPGREAALSPRGDPGGRTLRALTPDGREPAWLRQVHSADVLDATAGCAGEGDALLAPAGPLALAVVTADCVPVLIAGDGEIAAVHAGWRGIAGRIVPAALERMKQPTRAWIGPAIGPCCYEVGDDVAARVLEACGAAAGDEVVRPGPRGRPHLDLRRAVRAQLDGVVEVVDIGPCTRCSDLLWSYRRDGRAAGRNVALIWSVKARSAILGMNERSSS